MKKKYNSHQTVLNILTNPKIIITLLIFIISHQYWPTKGKTEAMKKVKLGFPKVNILKFDPISIHTTRDANLSRNLFNLLIYINEKGEIEPGLAEKVSYHEENIILKIRKGVTTKSGYEITPEDVKFSLERRLKNSKRTHGDIKFFLKKNSKIIIEEDQIILTAKSANHKEHLIKIFASTDYAIIPKMIVKKDEITDYSETGGPYYVSQINKNGTFILKANPNHYLLHENHIEQYDINFESGDQAIDSLKKGTLDLLTTVNNGSISKYHKLREESDSFNVYSSEKIKLSLIVFTNRGRKELSVKERLYISKQFKNAMKENQGYSTTTFLPHNGVGHLNKEQRIEINGILNKDYTLDKQKPISIWVSRILNSKFNMSNSKLSAFNIEPMLKAPWKLPTSQQPHAFVAITDSSFFEDFSLIAYNFSTETFGTQKEGDVWLKNYLAEPTKVKRIKMLNELHFKVLKEAYVIPLTMEPYFAAARAPIRFDMPKSFAGTPLWKIYSK